VGELGKPAVKLENSGSPLLDVIEKIDAIDVKSIKHGQIAVKPEDPDFTSLQLMNDIDTTAVESNEFARRGALPSSSPALNMRKDTSHGPFFGRATLHSMISKRSYFQGSEARPRC